MKKIKIEEKEIIKLKCKNCERVWDYKGKNHYFATCPNCLRKVSLKSRQFFKLKKEEDKQ